MKKLLSILFAIIICCLTMTASADNVQIPKKNQGIVNEVLYETFNNDMSSIFKQDLGPAFVVGMTASQMEVLISNFEFNFAKSNDPIAYVGQSSQDSKIIFMALMNKDKTFLLVSLIPKKDYMAYESEFIDRKTAQSYLKNLCDLNFVSVTYEQMKKADEMVGGN